ncbi:hypothetical protein AAHB43_07935 [Staphylococcus pseudintermedius]
MQTINQQLAKLKHRLQRQNQTALQLPKKQRHLRKQMVVKK